MSNPVNCGQCIYWRDDSYNGRGECRFHAPQIGPQGATWPATESDDWCGDGCEDEKGPAEVADFKAIAGGER